MMSKTPGYTNSVKAGKLTFQLDQFLGNPQWEVFFTHYAGQVYGAYKRMRQMARMKITNISLLLICFLISAFFYSGAFASTIVYKDKHGKCLKRVIVKANETIYYDCHGKYLGKEVKRGKKVYIYDNHGTYKGSMNY